MHVWNKHAWQLTESTLWFLVWWNEWKAVELVVPRKVVNQKQYYTHGGIIEISAILKDLKDIGMVISTPAPFNNHLTWAEDRE